MKKRIISPLLVAIGLIVLFGSQLPQLIQSACIGMRIDASVCRLERSEQAYVHGRNVWNHTWLESASLTDSGAENQAEIERFRYSSGSAEYRVLSGAIMVSIESFSGAALSNRAGIRQSAEFFRGNALYWQGELFLTWSARKNAWEWAVTAYSGALAIDPKDERAKTNQDYVRAKIQEASQSEERNEENGKWDEPSDQTGSGSESKTPSGSGSESETSKSGSGSEKGKESGTESSGSTSQSGSESGKNQQGTWTNQGSFNGIGESNQVDQTLSDQARQELESYAQSLQRYQTERDTYYNPSGKKDSGQGQSELYQMLKNQPLFRDMFQDEEPGKRNW